eukprot:234955_1
MPQGSSKKITHKEIQKLFVDDEAETISNLTAAAKALNGGSIPSGYKTTKTWLKKFIYGHDANKRSYKGHIDIASIVSAQNNSSIPHPTRDPTQSVIVPRDPNQNVMVMSVAAQGDDEAPPNVMEPPNEAQGDDEAPPNVMAPPNEAQGDDEAPPNVMEPIHEEVQGDDEDEFDLINKFVGFKLVDTPKKAKLVEEEYDAALFKQMVQDPQAHCVLRDLGFKGGALFKARTAFDEEKQGLHSIENENIVKKRQWTEVQFKEAQTIVHNVVNKEMLEFGLKEEQKDASGGSTFVLVTKIKRSGIINQVKSMTNKFRKDKLRRAGYPYKSMGLTKVASVHVTEALNRWDTSFPGVMEEVSEVRNAKGKGGGRGGVRTKNMKGGGEMIYLVRKSLMVAWNNMNVTQRKEARKFIMDSQIDLTNYGLAWKEFDQLNALKLIYRARYK